MGIALNAPGEGYIVREQLNQAWKKVGNSQSILIADSSRRIHSGIAAPCFFTMSDPALYVSSSASTGSIAFTATDESCPFTVTSNSAFITIIGGGSGTGGGAVTFSVAQDSGDRRTGTVSVGGQSFTVTQAGALGQYFVPITPCRLADTRNANGPFGGPRIAGQSTRSFTVPNSSCSIPSSAQAYSLNLTVVPQSYLGYLTVWPAGQAQPLVSTLNSDGRIKANAAIVPAGAGGAISIFASNTIDVIIDINGYFVDVRSSAALAYYPVPPCRISDTRSPNGPFGGPFVAGQTARTIPMRSSSCSLPATAQAYSVNFTAVPHGPLGFLTASPTGQSRPLASTLNASNGVVTANAAIVPAGINGSFDIFATNDTDLVVDITGYFAPPAAGGLAFYSLSPCRTLDSRLPTGSLPFTGATNINVAGSSCSPPSEATSYVFNVTVVPAGPLGYLTLWPQGTSRPIVSTLNAIDGAITGNMAIVQTSNGFVSALATDRTHIVLDLFGYFAP
ncbi:MAG: hypothetical protein M3Z09_06245 [Acidobacteriota bacterium]|nr:hypothetical protein [Acidobacteriota bacterium]